MFYPEIVQVNERGHLTAAGVDLVELAAQYGTPLYVYDEDLMRRNCRSYRETFSQYYSHGEIAYAGKAFLTMAMCRLLCQEGLSLDVVSAGELYLAQKAGFPMERVYFHGNNKSASELHAAVELGVGRVVVDNAAELEQLAAEAERQRRAVSILLRIKPGVSPHTHQYIQTGQVDSKFGLGISDGQAIAAVKRALKAPRLHLSGLHCHIGSQILDPHPFAAAAGIMVSLLQEIRRKVGVTLPELNLGGGLGIRYTRVDQLCGLNDFLHLLSHTVTSQAAESDFPLPKLTLEPGRSIVGEAGLTLYTIGTIKEVPGIRRYAAVDGGMTDNLRPALYGARYEAALANRAGEEATQAVTIAGKACESSDIILKDIVLPSLKSGDILAVFSTGAYHFSMFSHYNRHLRPAVVFLSGGRAELVVRRESLEDLTRPEIIPPHLQGMPAAEAKGA
ncbi:MAG: diaminopimelate decarboxylase [Bacillota bacterium]